MRTACLLLMGAVACGDDATTLDGGFDAAMDSGRDAAADVGDLGDAGRDAFDAADVGFDAGFDAGEDAATNCLLEGREAGERYSLPDDCNFCDCLADGTTVCTDRMCPSEAPGCSYDGVERAYAERFPSTDGINECVCAASGLACTRRDGGTEEGAQLLESLDEACAGDPGFTGAAVLSGLPTPDFRVAFPYERERDLYPESLADTDLRVRVVYDQGFVVCRVPSPSQPAIDMEVVVEWISDDGAFDEAHHTYLRRNNFGFLDAWFTVASSPVDGLDGSYDPGCLDPRGFSFSAQFNADASAEGSISKICEADILLDVGRFAYAP